jgi:hypothetical protein
MAIEIKDDVVTMSVAEYEKLYDDSLFLNCLRNAGVDNWQGYECAQDEYRQYEDDDE